MGKSIIKTKSLLIALVLFIVIPGLSFSSYAKATDFYYEEIDGQLNLTGFEGKVTETIEFPSKINGKKVVSIGDHIFDGYWNSDYEKIKKIVMPDTITSIGECAFRGCKGLKSVVLSKNLTEIKSGAFCDCDSLERISIPKGVKEIADNLFSGCEKLKDISFSKDVKRIGYLSFSSTGLESFTFPEGIKEVEYSTFSSCGKLKYVYLPESINKIDESAFAGCTLLNKINIPSKVEEIGPSAFWHCDNLEKIDLPKSTKYIGDYAFCFSGLKKITMTDSVVYIGVRAFETCDISTIKLSKNLKFIGNNAFESCSFLKEITIPGSVVLIPSEAFILCDSLKTVIVENGVKHIAFDAFSMSGVETLILPDSIVSLDSNLFKYCNYLKNVYYSGNKKQWKSIDMAKTNKEFLSAEITYNYVLPEHNKLKKYKSTKATCEKNGYTSGVYCSHCKKWIKGHQKIEVSHLDKNNDKLCDVCNKTTLLASGKYGEDIFWNLYDNGELFISGSGFFSHCDLDWEQKLKVKKVIFEEGIENTGSFYCYKNLEEIVFPKSMKTIDSFVSCEKLDNVIIPDNVTKINSSAFENCRSLKTIRLPSNLKTINAATFEGCESLKIITIPYNVKKINNLAFSDCINLKRMIIPDNVKSIDYEAFSGCVNLKSVDIGKHTKKINSYSFDNCPSLEKITVNKENKYFYSDKNGILFNKNKTKLLKIPENLQLNSYCIPGSVTYVGSNALGYLSNVDVILIPISVKKMYYSDIGFNDGLVVCYEGSRTQFNKVKLSEDYEAFYDKNTVICDISRNFLPSKVEIKKTTSGNKQITLTWKPVSKAEGYVAEYSTSKDFSSETKQLNLGKSAKKTTIKKLKKGKKYYVRVKAYKTVNGKKIYGSWSAVKSVKIK